jgi:tetratricopeptide (TPR) repeat protein
MPEPHEARTIIEHAEQAAATGDYASAEDLLREAAALQEQTLGPHHPELANTLNNLGIVCEMTDNPIDAEHYFRRAYAIATATLAPDHPVVATSRKNLHDFCAARGRPWSCRRHRRKWQPGWKRPRLVQRQRASCRRRRRSRT